jgi:hypothetical protein
MDTVEKCLAFFMETHRQIAPLMQEYFLIYVQKLDQTLSNSKIAYLAVKPIKEIQQEFNLTFALNH